MNFEFSAKGATHNSLGQRPRTSEQTGSGLKARTIIGAVAMVRAFSPDFSLYRILGRCPRLLWGRAFGADGHCDAAKMKRSRKLLITVSALAFTALPAMGEESPKHNFRPEAGYVPDAATAIKIAVAVWEPIYGAKAISNEKPYQAVLSNGVWLVTGSLPKRMVGGAAVAEIAKEDGKILRVSHGK